MELHATRAVVFDVQKDFAAEMDLVCLDVSRACSEKLVKRRVRTHVSPARARLMVPVCLATLGIEGADVMSPVARDAKRVSKTDICACPVHLDTSVTLASFSARTVAKESVILQMVLVHKAARMECTDHIVIRNATGTVGCSQLTHVLWTRGHVTMAVEAAGLEPSVIENAPPVADTHVTERLENAMLDANRLSMAPSVISAAATTASTLTVRRPLMAPISFVSADVGRDGLDPIVNVS